MYSLGDSNSHHTQDTGRVFTLDLPRHALAQKFFLLCKTNLLGSTTRRCAKWLFLTLFRKPYELAGVDQILRIPTNQADPAAGDQFLS